MIVMVFLNSGSACVVKCATMKDEAELGFFNEKAEACGKFQQDQVAGWAVIHEETSDEKAENVPVGAKLQ